MTKYVSLEEIRSAGKILWSSGIVNNCPNIAISLGESANRIRYLVCRRYVDQRKPGDVYVGARGQTLERIKLVLMTADRLQKTGEVVSLSVLASQTGLKRTYLVRKLKKLPSIRERLQLESDLIAKIFSAAKTLSAEEKVITRSALAEEAECTYQRVIEALKKHPDWIARFEIRTSEWGSGVKQNILKPKPASD